MAMAFTYQKGTTDGDYLMQVNPTYRRIMAARTRKLKNG